MILEAWVTLRNSGDFGIQKRLTKAIELKAFARIDKSGRVGLRFEGPYTTQLFPSFKFINIEATRLSDTATELDIALTDDTLTPLFSVVCEDLISISSLPATSLNNVLARLDHWKTLLDEPDREAFSPQKARGLVGELLVLERAAKRFTLATAISAWNGPMSTQKDFYFDTLTLEVKTVGSGAKRIQIQSPDQLEPQVPCDFALCVIMLTDSDVETNGAFSLRLLLDRIVSRLDSDQASLQLLIGKLQCLGWHPDITANDYNFLLASFRVFQVVGAFPKISTNAVPNGISFLRYELSLAAIDEFESSKLLPEGLEA